MKNTQQTSSSKEVKTTEQINNVEFITNEIFSRRKATEEKIRKERERIEKYNSKMNEHESFFLSKANALHQVLTSLGLNITSLGYHKNGINDSEWADGDALSISVTAVPFNNKVKFLAFAGYDSRGAGRNQKRLNEKSKSIAEKIKAATGLNCSVNPFSLEARRDEDKINRVLIGLSTSVLNNTSNN